MLVPSVVSKVKAHKKSLLFRNFEDVRSSYDATLHTHKKKKRVVAEICIMQEERTIEIVDMVRSTESSSIEYRVRRGAGTAKTFTSHVFRACTLVYGYGYGYLSRIHYMYMYI